MISSSDENGLNELNTLEEGIMKINEFYFDKDEWFSFMIKIWPNAKILFFENCKFLNNFNESLDIKKCSLHTIVFKNCHIDFNQAEEILQCFEMSEFKHSVKMF